MATEIERRFLVTAESAEILQLNQREGSLIRQGYITSSPDGNTCRVRIANERATLTIKGKARGATRPEFELPINLAEAREILQSLTVGSLIEKTRHRIPHCSLTWEVDVFHGENEGLIIAEVELESEKQKIALPTWIEREITTVSRYANANLAQRPYKQWSEKEKTSQSIQTPST